MNIHELESRRDAISWAIETAGELATWLIRAKQMGSTIAAAQLTQLDSMGAELQTELEDIDTELAKEAICIRN